MNMMHKGLSKDTLISRNKSTERHNQNTNVKATNFQIGDFSSTQSSKRDKSYISRGAVPDGVVGHRQIRVGLCDFWYSQGKPRDFLFGSLDALLGAHGRHWYEPFTAPLRRAFWERIPGRTVVEGYFRDNTRDRNTFSVGRISRSQGYHLGTSAKHIREHSWHVEVILDFKRVLSF